MARYKGKREAPRPEKPGVWGSKDLQEEQAELQAPAEQAGLEENRVVRSAPFPVEAVAGPVEEEGDPFSDPFDEEEPAGKAKRKFFASKAGKVVIIVLCAVLAFTVGGVIAVSSWIRDSVKPPDLGLLNTNDQQQQQERPDQGLENPEEPAGPTDEELYPDDGYDGDMPTVSGDRKEGVYTFLLVGTDKDDGNTDTIMVVSYDTVNQNVNIMSIPRDTMINEWWDIKKINSVYSRTGSSIDSLANRVRKLVGFKPDFYVKVDLSMFVQLVDLVGGVDFYVPQDMDYDDPWQDLHIHLKEGQQTLDGDKAMQLVRFRRYAEGDIKRVEVQQNFMKALIKECLSIGNWGKIKHYIDLGMENVQTDLDFGSVVWFAANVIGLYDAPMLSMDDVYTCTIPGNYFAETWSRDTKQNQSYVTIYANQTVQLVNERFNPYVQNVTTGMLDAMSILDNGNIASSTGSLKDTKHNDIMAVRRGEAYYDADGNIVYGQPPEETETPQMDEFGNFYILDEAGNIIYTDENGTPLGEGEPLDGPGGPDVPPTDPTDPSGGETGGTEDPGVTVEPELPGDPILPPEEGGGEASGSGGDSEMPGWLRP